MRTSVFLNENDLDEHTLARIHALNDIAKRRGQSLAQMALAWALRDPRMTSLIIGASSVEQLETNVAALDNLAADRTTSWTRSTAPSWTCDRPRREHTILAVVVGSRAYGLAGPDSDHDRRGVYAAPTALFWRLDKPPTHLDGPPRNSSPGRSNASAPSPCRPTRPSWKCSGRR